MNKRRFSYGLLVTLAAAVMVGCGDSTPPPDTAPQPTAAPVDTAAAAPTVAETAAPAPTPGPEPPPPPLKSSKDKWGGAKWVEDFSGDVQAAADVVAKKKAGKKDPDNKKYNAAMDTAKAAAADNVLETTSTSFNWNVKGKAAHTLTLSDVKGDDPSTLTFNITKDGKKDLSKKPIAVTVTFKDDSTFEMKDPFAKDPSKAMTLVFKKQ